MESRLDRTGQIPPRLHARSSLYEFGVFLCFLSHLICKPQSHVFWAWSRVKSICIIRQDCYTIRFVVCHGVPEMKMKIDLLRSYISLHTADTAYR